LAGLCYNKQNLSQLCFSDASRPEILQNTGISKPAAENNYFQKKIGGHTAAILDGKVAENRPENFSV
jgi:hypothetical protein